MCRFWYYLYRHYLSTKRGYIVSAIKLTLASTSALLLVGCSQLQSLYYGEPNFNTAVLLPSVNNEPILTRTSRGSPLQPVLGPPDQAIILDALSADCTNNNNPTQSEINNCVYALKRIIDDQYREYRITLHHLADGGNAVADIAALSLTTAATATGAAVAKTVLAALASGVLGIKTALNQDLLYKQTIEVVLNQMDGDRDKQFSIMLKQMNGSPDSDKVTYPLGAAKDDLLIYFQDGTFDHGLTSLQTAAAASKANCQAQLENTKVSTGAPDTAAGKEATAATTAPATSAGCAAPASNPPIPAGISATPPTTVSLQGGRVALMVDVKSMSDDNVTFTLDNITSAQVSKVFVFGKQAAKPSNSVTLTKSFLPAGGGTIEFDLTGLDPAKTPTIDASAKSSAGTTSYEIAVHGPGPAN